MRGSLVLCIFVLLASCENMDPDVAACTGDCPLPTIDSCKKVWSLQEGPSLMAVVDNNTLNLKTLQTLPLMRESLEYKPFLTGDFYVRIRYTDFTPGVIGSLAQAVIKGDDGSVATGSISTLTNSLTEWAVAGGFSYLLSKGLQSFSKTGVTKNGLIEFNRVGQTLTITVTPDGGPPSSVTDSFTNTPAQLVLQLGSYSNSGIAGPGTSIQIQEITILDANKTVYHQNSLACNSITP